MSGFDGVLAVGDEGTVLSVSEPIMSLQFAMVEFDHSMKPIQVGLAYLELVHHE